MLVVGEYKWLSGQMYFFYYDKANVIGVN